MRRCARLHADQASRLLLEELQESRSAQTPPQHNLAGAIDAMRLKYRFRDIQPDRNGLHCGSPPARTCTLRCRRGGEPSTASEADVEAESGTRDRPRLANALLEKRG